MLKKKNTTSGMNESKQNRSVADKVYIIIVYFVLIFYACSMIFMVGWTVLNTFKFEEAYMYNGSFSLLWKPDANKSPIVYEKYKTALLFGNYIEMFKHFRFSNEISYYSIWQKEAGVYSTNVGFFGMMGNTLFYAGFCAFISVMTCYSMAFHCCKYKYKFSKFIYVLVISIMSIPIVGSQAAMIKTLQQLGLYSTYIGMVCMCMNFTNIYFLVFYAFFETLSDSYIEAAEVDGASQIMIFTRIIIPLGAKMIGTVTLLTFVSYWNDYNMSFLYMPTIPNLSFTVWNLMYNNPSMLGFTPYTVIRLSAAILMAMPLIIIFIFSKDLLMGNISAGGLKG